MEVRVNPTRMQLLRLKKRLGMAVRGHKLLKDKRDELMKRFLALVKETRSLRESLEADLSVVGRDVAYASMQATREVVEQALTPTRPRLELEVNRVTVMSVRVPHFELRPAPAPQGPAPQEPVPPYGVVAVPPELDEALAKLSGSLPRIIRLAEVEKSVELLADEIEKTRRRVNALEYVLIPQLEATVRYITMKLDEMERGNLTRLMKVKDIVRAREV